MRYRGMSEDEMYRKLEAVSGSLQKVRLRAAGLIDDAVTGIDSALMSDIWDTSRQLDVIEANLISALQDVEDGIHERLGGIPVLAAEVMADVEKALAIQFTGLLSAIEDYVYAEMDQANRELQALVYDVDEAVSNLTGAAYTTIDTYRQKVEEDEGGFVDQVVTSIQNIFTDSLSMAEALVGVAGDIVNPMLLGFDLLTDKMLQGFTGLLSLDPEQIVEMQEGITAAWTKRVQGS